MELYFFHLFVFFRLFLKLTTVCLCVCIRNKKKLQKEKKNKLNCRCDDYDKCMFKGKLGFQLLRHESALKGPPFSSCSSSFWTHDNLLSILTIYFLRVNVWHFAVKVLWFAFDFLNKICHYLYNGICEKEF